MKTMVLSENICNPILLGTPSAFPNSFGVLGGNWLELTAVALMASTMILVVLYLFATLTRNQNFVTWIRFEMYQLLGTVTIVILTVAIILGGMCSFDMSFLDDSPNSRYIDPITGDGKNMYDIAEDYLLAVEGVGKLLFGYLMYVVKIFNFIAKSTWTSHPIGVGSANSPLESFAQINSVFFYLVGGYMTSLLLLQLQVRMLEYLSVATLFFLYPFGVFFRAFEPTRLFGGTLIGLAISLFLFYPIILVFNDYIVRGPTGTEGFLSTVMAETQDAVAEADSLAGAESQLPNAEDMDANKDALNDAGTQGALVEEMSYGMIFLLKPVLLYFLAAVVLPIINFIVLVEITRGITHIFGEEVDVTNITRMI